MKDAALYACLTAALLAALLTPLAAKIATRLGAIDRPRARGLSDRETPRLGGLAIYFAASLSALLWLPLGDELGAILIGALVIVTVGAIDDIYDLAPIWKLAGQISAAVVPVAAGVRVGNITLPFLGAIDLASFGAPLTLLGLIVVMNVVNFTDGLDGLAAGVCAISALTFALIAFDLGKEEAAVLAVLTAGSALGFLFHNFPPASIFMGDSGSNLLGFLLGCTAVQGTLKTSAVVALIIPLVILAVPFLDTGFVIAKRIKYGQPIYQGDAWHFHHRFANIGFSQRRAVLYLYGWTSVMAMLALALRFIPYSDDRGNLDPGWTAVLALLGVAALAASFYLVLVLEILKFKRLRTWQMRRIDPQADSRVIEARVAHDMETGEFGVVKTDGDGPAK